MPPARADTRPGGESISIDQLVAVAVRRSPTLAFAKSARRRAALSVDTAGAAGQWRLEAGVAADRTRDAGTGTAAAAGEAPTTAITDTTLTGTVGLAKQVPTGGQVAVELGTTGLERRSGGTTARGATATAQLSIDQPLLRGVGQGAHVDREQARHRADAAALQAEDDSAALVLEMVSAYWELAYAHADLAVREQSFALAKSQQDLTKKMYDRGTVPESAVKAARYGVALREEARLRARDTVHDASLRLRELAGLEIAIELADLEPADALTAPRGPDAVETVVATALAHNPRIAAARADVRVADVELRRRRNAKLPALDLSATAAARGAGPDRAAAADAARTGASYQVGGSLTFRWEIGGAASAAAEIARLDRSDARTTANDVERQVIAGVLRVVQRLDLARQRAVVADRAIELATANLDTELALFRADRSNNVQVFERQTELDEARLRAARATADALIASATLDYLTGELLDRHGIEAFPPRGGRHADP